MRRPICLDFTHLVSRLGIPYPSGIDKVDLAYGRYFTEGSQSPGVHYGWLQPHILSADRSREIVSLATQAHWEDGEVDRDRIFRNLKAKLTGNPNGSGDQSGSGNSTERLRCLLRGAAAHVQRARLRLARDEKSLPINAIYLNAAQHAFERHRFFRWIATRPDVLTAFVIHDLLPLDFPEYFPTGYKAVFTRRVDTMTMHGKAFIVSTNVVRDRLKEELKRREVPSAPVHVEPFPTTLVPPGKYQSGKAEDLTDPELSAAGYFVCIGTIEPRKNHLLLLNIWRQIVSQGEGHIPKLVIIGGRGWENEQAVDVLDRGRLTRPYVIEGSGLSSAGLRRIVANARALLMPSFAEGYGLPLVEALTLGTPVVTTDRPVFREVTQGCATYLSPIDGVGWRRLIQQLTADAETLGTARAKASQFRPPTWDRYFSRINEFLDSL